MQIQLYDAWQSFGGSHVQKQAQLREYIKTVAAEAELLPDLVDSVAERVGKTTIPDLQKQLDRVGKLSADIIAERAHLARLKERQFSVRRYLSPGEHAQKPSKALKERHPNLARLIRSTGWPREMESAKKEAQSICVRYGDIMGEDGLAFVLDRVLEPDVVHEPPITFDATRTDLFSRLEATAELARIVGHAHDTGGRDVALAQATLDLLLAPLQHPEAFSNVSALFNNIDDVGEYRRHDSVLSELYNLANPDGPLAQPLSHLTANVRAPLTANFPTEAFHADLSAAIAENNWVRASVLAREFYGILDTDQLPIYEALRLLPANDFEDAAKQLSTLSSMATSPELVTLVELLSVKDATSVVIPKDLLEVLGEESPVLAYGLESLGREGNDNLVLGPVPLPTKTEQDVRAAIDRGKELAGPDLIRAIEALKRNDSPENTEKALHMLREKRLEWLESSPLTQEQAAAAAGDIRITQDLIAAYGDRWIRDTLTEAIRWAGTTDLGSFAWILGAKGSVASANSTHISLPVAQLDSRELAESLFHEVAHHREVRVPADNALTTAWRTTRTGEDAEPVLLSDVRGQSQDASDAKCLVGDFGLDEYVGRYYDDGRTEVLSTAMEHFVSAEKMLELAVADSGQFYLALGILRP